MLSHEIMSKVFDIIIEKNNLTEEELISNGINHEIVEELIKEGIIKRISIIIS